MVQVVLFCDSIDFVFLNISLINICMHPKSCELTLKLLVGAPMCSRETHSLSRVVRNGGDPFSVPLTG